jgi:hypothetical protein
MLRCGVSLFALMMVNSPEPKNPMIASVCDLAKNLAANRDNKVAVRGVYYYGLRQECPQKCAAGIFPSFFDLVGGPDADWSALNQVEQRVEAEAKTGKRFEIWVTVVGHLKTKAKSSRKGPCDEKTWRSRGYGHLGAYPAQLVVDHFADIELKVNPNSPYDYGHMYHGPL